MERARRPDRGALRERRETLRQCSRSVAAKLRADYLVSLQSKLHGLLTEIRRLQSIADDVQFQIESYDKVELTKQLAKYLIEIGAIEVTLASDELLPDGLSPEGFVNNHFVRLERE